MMMMMMMDERCLPRQSRQETLLGSIVVCIPDPPVFKAESNLLNSNAYFNLNSMRDHSDVAAGLALALTGFKPVQVW